MGDECLLCWLNTKMESMCSWSESATDKGFPIHLAILECGHEIVDENFRGNVLDRVVTRRCRSSKSGYGAIDRCRTSGRVHGQCVIIAQVRGSLKVDCESESSKWSAWFSLSNTAAIINHRNLDQLWRTSGKQFSLTGQGIVQKCFQNLWFHVRSMFVWLSPE